MCIFAVTPLAGVWIEISLFVLMYSLLMSLPLRECGLKLCIPVKKLNTSRSLPLRECGLKFRENGFDVPAGNVTPLAGVWIEIPMKKE